jgi:hypothetical protein
VVIKNHLPLSPFPDFPHPPVVFVQIALSMLVAGMLTPVCAIKGRFAAFS